MAKKAYIGIQNFTPHYLPDGYTEVEYIESTGSQYIDTGVVAKSTLKIQIKFCLSEVQGYSIIGYYNSESDAFRLFNASGLCYLDFGDANETGGRISGGSLATGVIHEVEFGNLYVKDLTTGSNIISGTQVSAFTKSTNVYLCGNSNYAKGKFYYIKIYDGTTLVRDFIPCKNASDDVGIYDTINNVFYTNNGTGTFVTGQKYGTYARKIKKQYIGVDGIARKIKKAYIGISGIARLWWNEEELSYYGTITELSNKRSRHTATTVGDYAIFGGGMYYYTGYNDTLAETTINSVEAYNSSLTRIDASSLQQKASRLAAATVGNYALFGGGYAYYEYVTAYDTSLTKSNATSLSQARYDLAATTVGNYALFGGGIPSYNNYSSTVDAYNSSLVRLIATNLSSARSMLAATTVGNYALFGGGRGDAISGMTTVDAYNASLTKTTPTAFTYKCFSLAATTVGNYALFAGGMRNMEYLNTVYAYDLSLTMINATDLCSTTSNNQATTVGKYALFLSSGNNMNAYDTSLTRTIQTGLSAARSNFAATTNKKFALFAGGHLQNISSVNAVTTLVDVYTAG